ncbi:gas vesicle protein K [Halorarum halophilum]|uniref:Gas vesicle protein K n=1 Tax=Halorarum halophilum TaxID=2743090 RepID=A0A7D5GCX6_9EURY|nr:gas vesicle protein K [Halobaculum halophilum]QLG28566.1 gas vesicle protein K [Halobaculum halophilum]
MTRIDVDGEDGDAASGVTALVVAVVEILVDALEHEALRRMESGRLTDEEIERVGAQLARIEDELEAMKETQGIEDEVAQLRGDLDSLVGDAVRTLGEEVDEDGPPRTAEEARTTDDGRTGEDVASDEDEAGATIDD